jgi:hypothetical protein
VEQSIKQRSSDDGIAEHDVRPQYRNGCQR